MNDRELLELAAKAAEYEYKKHSGCIVVEGIPKNWNPLIDDGDALRLANALGLVVDCSRPSAALPFSRHKLDLSEGGNNDAATRRAIVRAAAEIAKQQEQPR